MVMVRPSGDSVIRVVESTLPLILFVCSIVLGPILFSTILLGPYSPSGYSLPSNLGSKCAPPPNAFSNRLEFLQALSLRLPCERSAFPDAQEPEYGCILATGWPTRFSV